jgi:ectoine hydroxylase-related dioxygenase (phytanoyl-CoA dioxygenase family)
MQSSLTSRENESSGGRCAERFDFVRRFTGGRVYCVLLANRLFFSPQGTLRSQRMNFYLCVLCDLSGKSYNNI